MWINRLNIKSVDKKVELKELQMKLENITTSKNLYYQVFIIPSVLLKIRMVLQISVIFLL